MNLLEVDAVTKRFGGLTAVSRFSLTVGAGEIVGLIGPNGAGKTTVFHLLSGFYAPSAGAIRFKGVSVVGAKPHAICRRGLARTFQIVQPFVNLSALENVMVGAFNRTGDVKAARQRALEVLDFVGLGARRDVLARELTLSDRKRLEMARGLATRPELLDRGDHRPHPPHPRAGREPAHHRARDARDHGPVPAHRGPAPRREDRRTPPGGSRARPHGGRSLPGRGGVSFLELSGIDVAYGDLPALRGVTLVVEAGETLSVVGANGAGKTTMLRTISGLLRPRRGEVRFEGERIDRLPCHRVVERGLVHVPEGRKVFPSLAVRENLELGSYTTAAKARRADSLERVFTLFPRLRERMSQAAGTLSGGEQQMLAIGRALMTLPKLLMLDEPSLGLAPLIVKEIFHIIGEINRAGTTVLLVEQNTRQALALSRRGYVLENGRVALVGSGEELLGNEHVRRAYLGL